MKKMSDNKKRDKSLSRTLWGIVSFMIVDFVLLTGGILLEDKNESLSEALMTLAAIGFGLFALFGIVVPLFKLFREAAPNGGTYTPGQRPYTPHTTEMVSCRKCGYLGAKGSGGACPRCSGVPVSRVTSDTELVSCKNCGYIGVRGTGGACPRCNKVFVTKIK